MFFSFFTGSTTRETLRRVEGAQRVGRQGVKAATPTGTAVSSWYPMCRWLLPPTLTPLKHSRTSAPVFGHRCYHRVKRRAAQVMGSDGAHHLFHRPSAVIDFWLNAGHAESGGTCDVIRLLMATRAPSSAELPTCRGTDVQEELSMTPCISLLSPVFLPPERSSLP